MPAYLATNRSHLSYFIEWAQELKKVLVSTLITAAFWLTIRNTIVQSRAVMGTTGGWRDPLLMEEAVANGHIDMCGLGRPLREEPDFVNKILEGKAVKAKL